MIAMARSIGHGGKYMDYMDGESKNKKHPEKIYFLQSHFLQPQLDGTALENAFKNRCRGHPGMKKYAIEIVFSPPPEYTKDFSLQDWARLEDDFTAEFDDIEVRCPKTGKLWSEKTNISGSKRVSFLHKESKSGVHHLHMGVCRVDENDNTNNDHMIHERAQWAAERVAIKRGWKTAAQVHKENVAEVSKMCRQILLKMDTYSFDKYIAEIEKRGYSVSVKEGNTGYAIMNGHAKYKGSELDVRHYTIPNLPSTWKKLHVEEDEKRREKEASTKNTPAKVQPVGKPDRLTATPKEPTLSHSVQKPIKRQPSKPIGNYLLPEPGCSFCRFYYDGIEFCRFLPDKFIQMVEDEYDYRYFEDVDLHIGLASAIFAGIYAGLMAQAQTSGGGGGGQSSSGWGRKKDEDDERWARRAIALANGIRPKKSKSTSRKY